MTGFNLMRILSYFFEFSKIFFFKFCKSILRIIVELKRPIAFLAYWLLHMFLAN